MVKEQNREPSDWAETPRTWFERRLRERMQDFKFFHRFVKAKAEIDAADAKGKAGVCRK